MGDCESNCEASGEPSRLLDKKDESLALGSLPSGSTSRQYQQTAPSTNKQNEPLQEVRVDQTVDTLSPVDRARVYRAVRIGNPIALCDLLNSDKKYIRAIDEEGNTALHGVVATACQPFCSVGFYYCINLLMNCTEIQVNMPNKKGYTAVGLAVQHLHKKCIEHMLKHPKVKRLYLDCYPGDSEYTVREIIQQKYPDLESRLPTPLMESLDSSESDIKLLAALQHDIYEVFSQYLSQTNPNPWYNEPYHSSLLEIACQMKNRKTFVKLLLDNGADPNIKNSVTGMPLIHATARSGNFELLEILLKKDNIDVTVKDSEQRTILHWWARASERNQGDKESLENCFKLLLHREFGKKVGIDCKDISGMTLSALLLNARNRTG